MSPISLRLGVGAIMVASLAVAGWTLLCDAQPPGMDPVTPTVIDEPRSEPPARTWEMSGRVTDEAGAPLPGATVTLYEATDPMVAGAAPRFRWRPTGQQTVTDERGAYGFDGLACRDDYAAHVTHPAYATGYIEGIVHCRLTPTVLPVVATMPRGSFEGVIRSMDGKPIAGARVELWHEQAAGRAESSQPDELFDATTTDEHGGYRLRYDGHERWRTTVDADGYASHSVRATEPRGGDFSLKASQTMQCTLETSLTTLANDDADVSIAVLQKGAVAGVVGSEHGEAVTSFTVELLDPKHVRGTPPDVRSFESDDGTFHYDDVESGEYVARIRSESYAPAESERFYVRSGEVTSGVRFTLKAEAAIFGVAVDANGRPLCGAHVLVWPRTDFEVQTSINRFTPSKLRQTVTADNGAFRVGELRGGRYELRIERRGQAPATRMLEIDVGQHLDLGEVALRKGATLTGACVDLAGRPIAEGVVSLFRGDSLETLWTSRTDKNGRYRVTHLAEGRYSVRLTLDRPGAQWPSSSERVSQSTSSSIEITGEGEHTLDFRLAQ